MGLSLLTSHHHHKIYSRCFSTCTAHDSVYDVLIAGGGIVGSTLACMLKENPLMKDKRIGVIEPSKPMSFQQNIPDLRVYTIAPSSRKILERTGAWDRIPINQQMRFQDMQVWDAEGNGFIRFAAADVACEELGHVIENNVLHRSLYEQVQTKDISLYENKVVKYHQSTPDERFGRLRLDNDIELKARLIVAADGANSIIRTQAMMGSWGWEYDQKAVVATVKTDQLHSTAWQRFLSTGPVALLPMRDGYSSIVWSCSTSMADYLVSATSEEFLVELNAAFSSPAVQNSHQEDSVPNVFSNIMSGIRNAADVAISAAALNDTFILPPKTTELIGKRFAFPLRLNHATRYSQQGLALIGDAAHTIHPLAGQGLNLGFSDVASLNKTILDAVHSGQDIGSEVVLSTYESDRKTANIGMSFVMDGFKRLFGPDMPSSLLSTARNFGLGTLNGISPVKNEIMKRAMGIK